MNGAGTGRRLKDRIDMEFVPGDAESFFTIGSGPIRERRAINVCGVNLSRLVDRIGSEESKATLHDGLVFFWSSFSRRAL